MGTGPASLIASTYKPRGLVLMSAYTTIKNVARNISKFGFLVANHFDNMGSIAKVQCPVLLIHGKKDPLITFDHSVRLFEIF
mmetsp:Transcript_9291/g.15647  ORF Transcript_9291/g.15647 Transcript_9291/m.15647 type:complete len:82 (+) Transcript_9291:682-927(+)